MKLIDRCFLLVLSGIVAASNLFVVYESPLIAAGGFFVAGTLFQEWMHQGFEHLKQKLNGGKR